MGTPKSPISRRIWGKSSVSPAPAPPPAPPQLSPAPKAGLTPGPHAAPEPPSRLPHAPVRGRIGCS